MAERKLPDIEDLRNALSYCPHTGILTWKWRASIRVMPGSSAGSIGSTGYVEVRFMTVLMKAHRAAWAIFYGEWPSGEIDHLNGVKTDNRIANLRNVTAAENSKNMPRQRNNKSGAVGVYWYARSSKWTAYIKVDGKRRHLGYFSDFPAAVAARKAAEMQLGFSQNHGRHQPNFRA